MGPRRLFIIRGERGNKTEKSQKENESASFSARCLRPGTIMGQELIKRAVDAAVFLINLTSALIKFVMTAELVPVRHQTQKTTRGGVRGSEGRGS